MSILITILVILLVLGMVGGFRDWGRGPWYGYNPQYVGPGIGTIVLILLIILLARGF